MRKLTDREKQIELVARYLMEEHGVSHLNLTFRNMTRTIGQFSARRGRIQLSTYFIARKSYRIMINTILHEIAHALTPSHGHDLVWKQKAAEIGALPRATAGDELRLKWIKEKKVGL